MSQTETGKAVAAEERTEAARSFVRTVIGCYSAQVHPGREGSYSARRLPPRGYCE